MFAAIAAWFRRLFSRPSAPKLPAPAPAKPAELPQEPPKPIEAPVVGNPPRGFIEDLIAYARTFVGTVETGHNHGVKVELVQREVDGAAEGEPYCMAAVQHWVRHTSRAHGIKSKLYASEHCLTVWNKTPKEQRMTKPRPGCIVIWRHGETSSGHTGLVVCVLPSGALQTVEGNTSASSNIEREGEGFWEKVRPRGGSGNMREVGFIWPV